MGHHFPNYEVNMLLNSWSSAVRKMAECIVSLSFLSSTAVCSLLVLLHLTWILLHLQVLQEKLFYVLYCCNCFKRLRPSKTSWQLRLFFFNYLVLRLWIHILKILTFSKENLSSFVKTNPIINWDSENKLS